MHCNELWMLRRNGLHRTCSHMSNSAFCHWMISALPQCKVYLCAYGHILSCSATEHDQTEWQSSLANSWYDTHFSLLEMHTDNSTNCTLLGPVDCDSFYKWIPLNRWPGCHLIRGIAFYLLCISISLSPLCVHHIIRCLFASLKMTEPVV